MRSSSAVLTRGTTERAFPGCGVAPGTAHFTCFGLNPQPASRSLFEIIVVDTIQVSRPAFYRKLSAKSESGPIAEA